MSITFECDNCGKKIKAQDHLVGKKVKCPKCAELSTVPDEDNEKQTKFEGRQRRTREKKKSSIVPILVSAGIGLLVLVIGAYLFLTSKAGQQALPSMSSIVQSDETQIREALFTSPIFLHAADVCLSPEIGSPWMYSGKIFHRGKGHSDRQKLISNDKGVAVYETISYYDMDQDKYLKNVKTNFDSRCILNILITPDKQHAEASLRMKEAPDQECVRFFLTKYNTGWQYEKAQ